MKCQNCKTALSCKCKERDTSDGKKACSKCIDEYEKKLQQNKTK